MKSLSLNEHASRIENLAEAREKAVEYTREIKIRDYIPGQVVYNMGDAPAKFSEEPTEYDYNLLQDLKDRGYDWIQLHDDWREWNNHWGGNTFTAQDTAGLRNFVSVCHDKKLKVIPYISATYFSIDDPDFRDDFSRIDAGFENRVCKLRACSLASPTWRKYNFDKTFETIDRYNFDGIYNDMGYDKFLKMYFDELKTKGKYESHVRELEYDPEVEDYLGMLYYETKKRGMYNKIHIGDFLAPPVKDKVYDYLWVGEAGKTIRDILVCKKFEPYIAPAFDRNTSKIEDPDLVYALTIPFVQFPVLYRGRPKGMYDTYNNIPNLKTYVDIEGKAGNQRREWYLAHPNGPHSYSEWSSIPDDPTEFDRSTKYLQLYKPMVVENTVVKVEVKNCGYIKSPYNDKIFVSLFTNSDQYMVVSNTDDKPYTVTLADEWLDRETNTRGTTFTIPVGRILFLKK